MEPTPELRAIARQLIGPGATEEAHALFTHALMVQATELREALLPFERVQKLNPDQLLSVQHGLRLAAERRVLDERLAQGIGADKPAYVPKRTWHQRVFGGARK